MSKALRETLIVLLITVLAYLLIIFLIMFKIEEIDLVINIGLILIPLALKFFFVNIYENLFSFKGDGNPQVEEDDLQWFLEIAFIFIIMTIIFLITVRDGEFWVALSLSGVVLALALYFLFTSWKRWYYFNKKQESEKKARIGIKKWLR